MKNRLIYDLCTPTRERRATTTQDIENDIQVLDFENTEEGLRAMLDEVEELVDIDDEELLDELYDMGDISENAITNICNMIDCAMAYCEDPGDGSPNFLYCSRNGEESKYAYPYYGLEDKVDLQNCTKNDVVEAILEIEDIYDDTDYDWDEED